MSETIELEDAPVLAGALIARPYATAAPDYWSSGWRGTLPLPEHCKAHPPKGWTGRGAPDPSYPDVLAWAEGREGAGNVGLRMPPDVVGLDVDNYGEKIGGETLDRQERELGALPPTWRTTSRDDGVSGIRLYRVPAGLRWPGTFGPGTEIVCRTHRYAVAPPSIHPEGRVYRWITPEGLTSTTPPRPDELPELPAGWLAGLTGGRMDDEAPKAALGDEQAEAWIVEHDRGDQPCADMRADVVAILDAIEDPARSAHEALTSGPGLGALVRHAERGHRGLSVALAEVRAAFLSEVTRAGRTGRTETEWAADAEWNRSLLGAIRMVVGAPSRTVTEHDPCQVPYLPGREPWNRPEPGAESLADGTNGTGEGHGPGVLPTLPDEFWSARPSLAHIRQAAHADCVSADAVLHCVLARLASIQHHATVIDNGLRPARVNLIVGLVGASSTGKTSANGTARDLLAIPESVALNDGYRDGVPIGSGEGLPELFMGTIEEETGEVRKNGVPLTVKRRAMVRHNALVWIDEAEGLFKMAERSGATIMPTLRSAWSGETIGQSNAAADTTRVVPAGSYALGLAIGIQPGVAGPLFNDAMGGTPQRFLFASAVDPSIPEEPVDRPGPWTGHAPIGTDDDRTIPLVDDSIRKALRRERIALARGEVVVDELDGHRPLILSKVAALLAVLDGRRYITGEDWSLAEQVWTTSRAVRTVLVEQGREREREKAEARTSAFVEREARAAVAREQAPERVERMALRLSRWVRDGDGDVRTRRALSARLASKERHLLDEAVEVAVARGWLTGDDDAGYRPGAAVLPTD